jgi:hypothetical protein
MNKNITLALPESILRRVRQVAVSRKTTVNGLVRRYLNDLVHGSSETLSSEQKKLRKKELQSVWAVIDRAQAEVGTQPTRKRTYARPGLS